MALEIISLYTHIPTVIPPYRRVPHLLIWRDKLYFFFCCCCLFLCLSSFFFFRDSQVLFFCYLLHLNIGIFNSEVFCSSSINTDGYILASNIAFTAFHRFSMWQFHYSIIINFKFPLWWFFLTHSYKEVYFLKIYKIMGNFC